MKYLMLPVLLIVLSSCVQSVNPTDGVVEIIGTLDGTEVVRGMWVCIDEQVILTSAHVVRDDRMGYEIWSTRYQVRERNIGTDIAYLSILDNRRWIDNDTCQNPRKYIWKTDTLKIWQTVSIPVVRSNSYRVLTGSITSLTGTILAYDTLGHTQMLSGMIMTDIYLEPWDSGAPILDEEGRVVDVVHVQ